MLLPTWEQKKHSSWIYLHTLEINVLINNPIMQGPAWICVINVKML